MFDFSTVMEYLRVEPGHGIIQSVLLFMIWIQSRGLRKELSGLGNSILEMKSGFEKRFEKVEQRISVLETFKKTGG